MELSRLGASTRRTLDPRRARPAEAIETEIEKWRRAVGAPVQRGLTPASQSEPADSQALTRLIFEPLRPAIGDAASLVIAPTEALYLVPFEALPFQEERLGDRFSLSYHYALSELTVEHTVEPSPLSLLALGGIDYDRREPSGNPPADLHRSVGAAATSLRAGSTKSAFAWSFGKLIETRGEALTVADYFLDAFEDQGVPEPAVLTRKKATRDAFESLAPQHRYIHLATHGWFAPEAVASTADDRVIDQEMNILGSSLRDQVIGLAPALLCGLAFAGANGEADMYGRVRGVMTAEEISAMDLTGVELCVLSACETNVGVRRGGQGIASLQTALHAAGVRTAITSLWKVPDEATRELMTEFYRRLWVLEEPKAQALWNAKKKLREQLDADGDPTYSMRDWAGWVLSGDPD